MNKMDYAPWLQGLLDVNKNVRKGQVARVLEDVNGLKPGVGKGVVSRILAGKRHLKQHEVDAITALFVVGDDLQASQDDTGRLVSVPFYDIRASAGSGALVASEPQSQPIAFNELWLRQTWHLSSRDLYMIGSEGDSMEPTIRAGEMLICSRAEHHITPGDGVYIIRLDGAVLVKRLQVLPGSRMRIVSDNPNYPVYEIALHEGQDFAILGKVMYSLRRF